MKKEEFDNIIKENIAKTIGNDHFGYTILETSKTYNNYYNKQSFFKFIEDMKSSHYHKAFCAYCDGKGSELIEHMGRYGKLPPKMASVASSSRFCFLALKDGASAINGTGEVKFEYECKIEGITGIAPQLDAYVQNENIFIEAKCHEIFDTHHIIMKTSIGISFMDIIINLVLSNYKIIMRMNLRFLYLFLELIKLIQCLISNSFYVIY